MTSGAVVNISAGSPVIDSYPRSCQHAGPTIQNRGLLRHESISVETVLNARPLSTAQTDYSAGFIGGVETTTFLAAARCIRSDLSPAISNTVGPDANTPRERGSDSLTQRTPDLRAHHRTPDRKDQKQG